MQFDSPFPNHLPPGEGNIEWPQFMDALARAGFNGGLVIEVVGREFTVAWPEGPGRAPAA